MVIRQARAHQLLSHTAHEACIHSGSLYLLRMLFLRQSASPTTTLGASSKQASFRKVALAFELKILLAVLSFYNSHHPSQEAVDKG